LGNALDRALSGIALITERALAKVPGTWLRASVPMPCRLLAALGFRQRGCWSSSDQRSRYPPGAGDRAL